MKSSINKNPFKRALTVLMVASLAGLSACGSDNEPAPVVEVTTTEVQKGTPLTQAQATLLSRLLFLNYQQTGSDLHIAVPFGIGSSISIVGVIDWKLHLGQAEVIVTTDNGTVADRSKIWWSRPNDAQQGFIVSSLKGLTESMAKSGRPGVNFVARPVTASSPIDVIVRYIDALSSDQAENPLLLRQDKRSGYLGTESVAVLSLDGDTAVKVDNAEVIRFGQSRYWIDPASRRMVQVSAALAGLRSDTVFSLTQPGAKVMKFPENAEVVDATSIPEIYKELTSPK